MDASSTGTAIVHKTSQAAKATTRATRRSIKKAELAVARKHRFRHQAQGAMALAMILGLIAAARPQLAKKLIQRWKAFNALEHPPVSRAAADPYGGSGSQPAGEKVHSDGALASPAGAGFGPGH